MTDNEFITEKNELLATKPDYKHLARYYFIFDRIAGLYGPLWSAANDAVAIRQFMNGMKKGDVVASDYELHYFFSMAEETGEMVDFKTKPLFLVRGTDEKDN